MLRLVLLLEDAVQDISVEMVPASRQRINVLSVRREILLKFQYCIMAHVHTIGCVAGMVFARVIAQNALYIRDATREIIS